MNHDPLCDSYAGCTCPPEYWMTSEDLHMAHCPIRMRCNCDLIAKVRFDQIEKIQHHIGSMTYRGPNKLMTMYTLDRDEIIDYLNSIK